MSDEQHNHWIANLKVGDPVVVFREPVFDFNITRVVRTEYGVVHVDGYPNLRFVEGTANKNRDVYRLHEPTTDEITGEIV